MAPRKKYQVATTLRLSAELHAKVVKLALRRGIDAADVIRAAIEKYLVRG